MKNLLFLLILILSVFGNLSAQVEEVVRPDTLTTEEMKMVGIWKLNISEQKNNMNSEAKAQVDQLDIEKQEEFWRDTESWVYVLDLERNFIMTWVEFGSYNEFRGTWRLDSNTKTLSLFSDNELLEFQVQLFGKGQIWTPVTTSKTGFNRLYIKKLGE